MAGQPGVGAEQSEGGVLPTSVSVGLPVLLILDGKLQITEASV